MPIITTLTGKQFPAEPSEILLDAALRANVILEHSCKTGRCGTCKSKVGNVLLRCLTVTPAPGQYAAVQFDEKSILPLGAAGGRL